MQDLSFHPEMASEVQHTKQMNLFIFPSNSGRCLPLAEYLVMFGSVPPCAFNRGCSAMFGADRTRGQDSKPNRCLGVGVAFLFGFGGLHEALLLQDAASRHCTQAYARSGCMHSTSSQQTPFRCQANEFWQCLHKSFLPGTETQDQHVQSYKKAQTLCLCSSLPRARLR